MNRFDGVRIFTSGLNSGFLGTGVAIIMNNSLARHVFKIKEISDHVISVHLLFKGKISVSIIGLYTCASSGNQFEQTSGINFFITRVVNSSSFVVLGGDFNKGRSKKSGVVKVIDYILISENLISAMASHKVNSVSKFFDTDHKAVLVLVDLDGLLNVHLGGLCKQASKDHRKFKLKGVNVNGWKRFMKCSLDKFLKKSIGFQAAKHGRNLDNM
ncbi:hypothetical protein G9A89_022115 [Geosiphon pyriformis]|nr:hypothetical protein G9A89_022115 [Geosiphon pyriformis]